MDELYEATGAGDKYKGFILVVCDEKGLPMICTSAEAPIVHFGLVNALERHLSHMDMD